MRERYKYLGGLKVHDIGANIDCISHGDIVVIFEEDGYDLIFSERDDVYIGCRNDVEMFYEYFERVE